MGRVAGGGADGIAALEEVHVKYGEMETWLQGYEGSEALIKEIFGDIFQPGARHADDDAALKRFEVQLEGTDWHPINFSCAPCNFNEPRPSLQQLADFCFSMYKRPAAAAPSE